MTKMYFLPALISTYSQGHVLPKDTREESFLSLPLQGPSCASGVSFSGRTLSHPSFWPLYQAASCRDLRPSLAGHQSEEQVPRAAGTALGLLSLRREPVRSLPPQQLLLPRVPGDVL